MTNYQAIITEETSGKKGQIIANTKSPGMFRGMTKDQFAESTKYISVFSIKIVKM